MKRRKNTEEQEKLVQGEKNGGNTQSATNISISGLDVQKAMEFLGNEELFWSVLKEYYRVIDKKYALIKKYAEEGKWREYTVEVHALKSASRQIGALDLATTAEQMEAAGNAKNEGLIRKITPGMLEEYRFYKDILAPYFTKEATEQNSGQMGEEKLESFFVQMQEAMENLDMEVMETLIQDMSSYSYNEEQKNFFEELQDAVADMDTEQCEAVIAAWKEKGYAHES